MDLIQRDDFWWPADDGWCHKVIHGELSDLDVALALTKGRDVAVQAGGNVGVWASHLAKTFARVETAEPDPTNYACLERNVPENVIHRRAAFGSGHGHIGMTMVQGNSGAHYVSGDGSIPTLSIDSLHLPSCDLLCLDVEGYEPIALKGAERTIRQFRPVIQFEEKGLSERYFGIARGAAEHWLIGLNLGYSVRAKPRADVIMAC